MAAFAGAGTALGAAIGGPVGAAIGGVLGSLLGGSGVDPRIAADINPAIARGDVAYLTAWVNDVPPHPTDSIQAARAGLAKLTGGLQYGGRLATRPPAPAFSPSGYLPVQLSAGRTIGIPFTG